MGGWVGGWVVGMSMAINGRGEGTKAKTRERVCPKHPQAIQAPSGGKSHDSLQREYTKLKNRHPLREAVSPFAVPIKVTTPATTKRVMFWVSELAAIFCDWRW